jgi:hypothetical protein
MYAGNKWLVYIDARIRQFLDEAEMSLVDCRSPNVPAADSARNGQNDQQLVPSSSSSSGTTPTTISANSIASSSPSSSSSSLSPFTTIQPTLSANANGRLATPASDCRDDPVDLMIILDTSTSVEVNATIYPP